MNICSGSKNFKHDEIIYEDTCPCCTLVNEIYDLKNEISKLDAEIDRLNSEE